jgi:hypothetical protein
MPNSPIPSGARLTAKPVMIVGKRRDEQYTVQASLSTLREAIPPSYFTPSLGLITDGKAVGEAIRVVGPDLIYVRFPVNESGHPVSFTLPRVFLIPVTCRILARQASTDTLSRQPSKDCLITNTNGTPSHGGGCHPGGNVPTSPAAGTGMVRTLSNQSMTSVSGSPASASMAGMVAHNNKDRHEHVDLRQHLGAQGEPALCVVCGRWDEAPQGQKRKSGHKCKQCIGKKSLDRLRSEFTRLLTTEENSSDDEEFATHM